MRREVVHHETAGGAPRTADEFQNGGAARNSTGEAPLDEVFLALAEDAENPRLRRISRTLADSLAAGADFESALRPLRGQLPKYMERLLATTADGAQAAAVLQALARHEATRRRMRQRLWSSLMYPLVVLGMLMLVAAALIYFVLPEFVALYEDLELDLPQSTLFLIVAGAWLPWTIAGLIAIPLGYFLLWLLPGGRRLAHWLRTGLPMFGRVWIWNAQHEFASVLGALVSLRVPLDEALRSTAASLRDHNVARATRIVARKCENGLLLSRSLAESMHFDPALPALVAWGEAHDALPDALRQAAAIFEDELDVYARFLRRILSPLLYVIIILVVFAFMAAIVTPLIQMINNFMW